jgi:type I restriction enzyme, S subunit
MYIKNMRTGYKLVQTRFKKYEEIPDDWDLVEIKKLCDVKDGSGFPLKFQQGDMGKFPFYKVSDMNILGNEKYMIKKTNSVSEKTIKELKTKKIFPNSIIFPKIGESLRTNKRRILSTISCIDNNMMALIPNNIDHQFLYYAFLRIKLENFEQVTTMPYVNDEIVENIKILTCKLSEQKKISSILSNLDDQIQKINQQIDTIRLLKKGTIQNLLKKGISHTKFKKIPWYFNKEITIPSKWKILSLKDISKNGLQNGIFKKPSEFGSGISLVNVVDLYSEMGIDLDNLDRVKVSDLELIQFRVCEGDIFFDRSSLVLEGIGQSNIIEGVSEPTVFECHVMKLTPNKLILPKFLFYFTKTYLFRQFVISISKTATMTTITQSDLEKAQILIPPLSEQKQILDIIQNIDLQLAQKKVCQLNLELLKKGLMQKLLTGQIRVKVP